VGTGKWEGGEGAPKGNWEGEWAVLAEKKGVEKNG